MNSIVCLHPDNSNPGDSIAHYSAMGLVNSSIASQVYTSYYLDESNDVRFNYMEHDYAIVSCTPWLWDQCFKSRKYKILNDFCDMFTKSKKIALGVGASYPLDMTPIPVDGKPDIVGLYDVQKSLSTWDKFDLIVTRDLLAYELFLNYYGDSKVKIFPCPSINSAYTFESNCVRDIDPFSRLLIYSNIECAPNLSFLDREIAKKIDIFQNNLIESGVPVLTMTVNDRKAFQVNYPYKESFHSLTPKNILEYISKYATIISPRVHGCMAALSLKKNTQIIPVDSRALTAINCGAFPIVSNLGRMEKYSKQLIYDESELKKVLRNFFIN